jgi:hypothetical protein
MAKRNSALIWGGGGSRRDSFSFCDGVWYEEGGVSVQRRSWEEWVDM